MLFFSFVFFLSIKPFKTDLYTYISISKLHSVNGSTVFNMNQWCFRSHCISIHIKSISSSFIQYGDWRMWICGLRSQCLPFTFYLADFGSMARFLPWHRIWCCFCCRFRLSLPIELLSIRINMISSWTNLSDANATYNETFDTPNRIK